MHVVGKTPENVFGGGGGNDVHEVEPQASRKRNLNLLPQIRSRG